MVRGLVWVGILTVCALVRPATAAVEWTVLESTPERLRVRLDVTGETLNRSVGDADWVRVQLAGAPPAAEPGDPELPFASRWVAVPLEGEARLTVSDVRTEALGRGRVRPAPTPRPVEERLPGEPVLVEVITAGDRYEQYRVGRTDFAELGEPVFTRKQRLAPLRVRPVLYDAASGTIEIVRSAEFTVEFPTRLARRGEPGAIDRPLRTALLNPDVASQWRGLPPRLQAIRDRAGRSVLERSAADLDPSRLLADPVRLRIGSTGMVRMLGAELLSPDRADLPATITRRQLRLVKLRPSSPEDPTYPAPIAVDVPLLVAGSPDESQPIGRSDEVLFYGLSVEDELESWVEQGAPRATPGRPDHYNGENVYFLLCEEPPAGSSWSRMERITASAFVGTDVATRYTRVEEFERDLGFQEEANSLEIERYHWNRGFENSSASGSVRFVHPVAGAQATVRFTTGRWDSAIGPWDYEIAPSGAGEGQGISLGRFTPQIADFGLQPIEVGVPTDGLSHGSWTFRMIQRAPGVLLVQGFFGEVRLTYPASYRADGDRLRFGLPETGATHDVEIPGFTTSSLYLFDVSDPAAPRVLDLPEGAVQENGGQFTLRVRLDRGTVADPSFLAVSRFQIAPVVSFQPDRVPDLFAAIDDVQVLVVGPEEFRAEGERWIDFRRTRVGGRDWNFAFVDVQQIYDEFSGGLQSPESIRSLAEWAYVQWDAKALFLLGDASEDPRDVSGMAGPNRVPVRLHIQSYDGNEFLASDKWYGIFDYAGTSFPTNLRQTSDLVVGRLPAGTVDELRAMMDKIIAYESPSEQDVWRRRTFWISDDSYSTDFLGSSSSNCYRYQPAEDEFAASQARGADDANAPLDGTLTSVFLNLDDYTREFRTGDACEVRGTIRDNYRAFYEDQFLRQLSEGWLLVSYQGHANYDVLGHEAFFIVDYLREPNVRLTNTGRPFVFFGMGCHVSDFFQAVEEAPFKPSIGETFVRLPQRGAIATYGSSGFEFLSPNAFFMEVIASIVFEQPRTTSPIFGDDLRSPWVLGEVLAQAELTTLATNVSRFDDMVAQYNLLGDPLQRLDAAAPRLSTQRQVAGDPPTFEDLADGTSLVADAGSTGVTLRLGAIDESGVDRIVVSDDQGRTYATYRPAVSDLDPRRLQRTLELPIHPQDYTIEVATWDGAYPDLDRRVRTYAVELQTRLFAEGLEVEDFEDLALSADRRTVIEIEFVSPVDLVADDIELAFDGVDLFDVVRSGSGREWTVQADAQLDGGGTVGSLRLVLQGFETTVVEPDGGSVPTAAPTVVRHAPMPNPFRDRTYISARVEGLVEAAELTVYDLTGRALFRSDRFEQHEVGTAGAEFTAITVEWSARDDEGDGVANGTYLYRLEVRGPGGKGRSDMGRVVVMR